MDSEIVETFKQFGPSTAYLMGANEFAGRLFIASDSNIKRALRTVRGLRRRASTDVQKKVLDSMETALLFDEPQPVLDDITGTIFAHLVKEGINDQHMLSLLGDAMKTIDESKKRFSHRKVPVAVKALTLYRRAAVLQILDTVEGETKSAKVKESCRALKAKVTDYVGMFELEGFGRGEFPNVEKIFRQKGFDLGRSRFYERALTKGSDYHESPKELEAMAIRWLEEELPRYRKVTQKLAKRFGCEAIPEEVEKRINARLDLDPKRLLKITVEIRKVVQRFVNEDVHGINPKYRTKVIETPPYLTGVIPTGAAQFFDTFTKRPFQVFFQTTDPKRDPDKSVSAVLDLLVHEEYGHCVHHSNSVVGFVGKVPPLHLLAGLPTGGPITEGLSFNRELEFYEASKRLESKKQLTKAEEAYVRLLDKYGGLKLINLELEFATRRWRVVRFLRVVGDVRVNSGKQGLIEFVEWASKYSGVPKSSVYYQLFPAHVGAFPGYATYYAVVGQEIREIERKIHDDRKRVKFSTYLCSIGFPPRTVYRKMLLAYAKKLK